MADTETPPIDGDVRARLVYVEHRTQDHKNRIGIIEKWAADINIYNAKRDTQWEAMVDRLNSIDGNIKWVVRLFFAALIMAFAAFVVSGGLNIPK